MRELIAQAEAFDEEVEYWSRVGDRIFNGNILAEHFKFRADELRAQAQAEQPAEPCIGNDPLCPCQDGDACHYRDVGKTKAMIPAEPQGEPVLVVQREPDYHSRGHYYEGKKSWIDPFKIYALPIGTKLYAHPDPRIAALEGLLERWLHHSQLNDPFGLWNETRAALGKEG